MRKVLLIAFFCFLSVLTGCDAWDGDGSDSPKVAELSAPPSDCFWSAEMTPGTEEIDNVLWPELNAAYWAAFFVLPNDALCFTLEGVFPYSRYMSMNSHDGWGGGSIDYILDQDITPNLGSTNPFVPGNARNDPSRIYTVQVLPIGEQNNCPAPVQGNVLQTPGGAGRFVYRVYLPDAGADLSGDAGLPRVTLYMADGSVLQGEEACAVISPFESGALQIGRYTGIDPEEYAEKRESTDPSNDPPIFRNYFSNSFHLRCEFGGDAADCSAPEITTGFGDLPDSRILYTFTNRSHGEVLVLRAKLPVTPETSQGQDMASEGDMRYWSVCSYEYYAQRAEDCLFDEQVQANEDSFYTIVFSREEDRPNNATSECGVSYLRWSKNGDGFGIEEGYENHSDDGHFHFRNIIPSTDFPYAIPPREDFGEQERMADYLPKGKYFTRAEFEALGCNPWLSIPYSEM